MSLDEERIHRTWLRSERTIPSRFVRPLLRFTRVEAAGGLILLAAALAALIWANGPFGDTYEEFWETHASLTIGPLHLDESLRHWVNDGLMVIFFFVVGLEIKRELVVGELRDRKTAALPVMAALGGMIFPAAIYVLIVGTGADATHGWGIPMATDIAFSVGIVALLGTRVPTPAKLFLLALAIVDDIGAIVVIAVFYTSDVSLAYLAGSIAVLGAMFLANRVGIRSILFYFVLGFFAWLFLLESGVHATLAGVAIGLLTPAGSLYSDDEYQTRARWLLQRHEMESHSTLPRERIDQTALELTEVATESVSPLTRIELLIHPWSSFLIVPVFALANAGIRFEGMGLEEVTGSVAIGVAVGLVVGKTLGVSLFTWLGVVLGLGRLPRRTNWTHIIGLAMLAGVGFTVSLFITGLAFDDPILTDEAKIGIFVGSGIAGVLGYVMLRVGNPPRQSVEPPLVGEGAGPGA